MLKIQLSMKKMYVCMYVCMYVYVCVYIHTHTHTHTHTIPLDANRNVLYEMVIMFHKIAVFTEFMIK